jgi:hypothetical protein
MEPSSKQVEKHLLENQLGEALSIVELEERFELTAAAADASRCTAVQVTDGGDVQTL